MNPMVNHVKILGILRIVFGALGILIGLGLFALFGGILGLIGANAPSDEAAVAIPIIGAVGGFVLLVLLVVSIPGLIAGIGLLSYKPWARILGIVISIVDLFQVPFGTILGFYGLWILLSREGTALFERPAQTFNTPHQPQRF
ncbi:MAG TPA: hypothetical protein VEQ63_10735 [Bryobacteraceae bacterium]|nr:hypothetical protein [Bryobacteraceae bacterium]